MDARRLFASLGLFALLGSCSRGPEDQVLHVRLTMAGEQLSGDAQPGVGSPEGLHNGGAFRDALSLALDVPVHASRPGEPFLLRPSEMRPPTFEGSARMTDESEWMNVDASQRVRINMASHWPHGTPATAPGASLRAQVESATGGGLAAELDADLLLTGTASDSRTGYGREFETEPMSPLKDCRLTTTQARCTLVLQLNTLPVPPGKLADNRGDSPTTWNREIRGMTVTWDADGHFVARADGQVDDPGADLLHVVHVVLWTSAPGDARVPPGTPTIAP